MSRARDFADLAGSADAGGITGRNMVINGAMQVRQRSDATGVTSTQYVNDRFQQILGTAGTWSISRSTEAPAGFSNSMKLDCTTARASLSAGSVYLLGQKIEGQNLQHLEYGASGAKKLTLSFWVRSNKTGTYIVEFEQTGNSRTQAQSYTIDAADTWEHKTITIDGDTNASGALANDNTAEFAVYWWVVAGSAYSSGTLNTSWASSVNANRAVGQVNLADSTSNEWYLTGVQLEVGSATPFEHRSFGDELRKCQRYYETSFDSAPSTTNTSNNGLIASGGIAGDTTTSFSPEAAATYKVSKRAVPSVTFYDLATPRNTGKCHRFQLGAQAHDNSAVTIADSGITRFNAFSGNGNACSGIAFHYEADAEL